VKFLDPLYSAVAWVMAQIHAGLSTFLPSTSGQAWFLTIVLLVVFMRLLLVPLFIKQMHSMRKMSALTPQLQELRKKYKGDKQTLNEETMRLYRENGVNPLGGCLPLVAQLPVFFALFNVLRGIADWKSGPTPYGLPESVVKSAQNANILGAHISDKVLFTGTMHVPLEAKIVILCFVTVSVITTFLTVRQNTKRGLTPNMTPDNPMAASQKYMAYIVPFFALSGLYWAFGLVLYWVTTNVWTLGQQWVLFKRYPAPVPGAAPAGGGTATATSARPAPAKPSTVSRGTSAKSVAPKSPGAAKPPAPAKPGGTAGPSAATGSAAAKAPAAKPPAAKPSAGKPPAAKPSAGKPPAAKPSETAKTGAAAAAGQASRKKTQAGTAPGRGSRPASTAGQPAANGSGSGSGLLRRLGRKAPEPEPQPETPEVKLVRQQRVRQSRSKRSGKR
jgi:YidC/Oxa1 family membrane protein insertase